MSAPQAPTRAQSARFFLGDTAVVFGAQVLTKLRGLITLPLLVRGLGTEAFGTWSQTLAFTVLVTAIVGLNLHLSLIRFVASDRTKAGVAYSTTLFASVVVATALCATLGALASPRLTDALIGTPDRRVLWVALAIVVTTTVRNLNLNLYRATDRIRLRSLIDLLGSMIELSAIFVVFSLGLGLIEAFEALAVIGLVVAVATTVHANRVAPLRRPDSAQLTAALRYGAPLVPASVALWVLDRSDRFVISHYLTQAEVGIYSAHYAIGSLILFVQGPIQMALVPKVMQLWDKDRETASQYVAYSFRVYAMIAMLFVVCAPLLSPTLFRLVANEEIARHCRLNVLLIAGGTSLTGLAIIETCGLYAARRTGTVGIATAVCAGLNFVLCAVLVPLLGIKGAAIATLASYFLMWLAWFIAARALWSVPRGVGGLARAAVATIPVGLFVAIVAPTTLLTFVLVSLAAPVLYLFMLFATGAISPGERRAILRAVRRRLQRPG
jgi:O-antigen/teichoic acid export membrane protein